MGVVTSFILALDNAVHVKMKLQISHSRSLQQCPRFSSQGRAGGGLFHFTSTVQGWSNDFPLGRKIWQVFFVCPHLSRSYQLILRPWLVDWLSIIIHQLSASCTAKLCQINRVTYVITPAPRELKWLPTKERLLFKNAWTFKCLNGLAPYYLWEKFIRRSQLHSRSTRTVRI